MAAGKEGRGRHGARAGACDVLGAQLRATATRKSTTAGAGACRAGAQPFAFPSEIVGQPQWISIRRRILSFRQRACSLPLEAGAGILQAVQKSGTYPFCMKFVSALAPWSWLAALSLAAAFLFWSQALRIHRLDFVSQLPGWSVDAPRETVHSPTGYEGGLRQQLVPQMESASYQWIGQAQLAADSGAFNLHHVDYDNAPLGRPTHLSALYRGWLLTLGRVAEVLTGASTGAAIERMAVYAAPLAQLLLLIGATLFIASEFGAASAALGALLYAGLYPLQGAFIPGAPDCDELALAAALVTLLLLAAAVRRAGAPDRSPAPGEQSAPARRSGAGPAFAAAAGVSTGIGLALGSSVTLSSIAAIYVGRVLLACTRSAGPARSNTQPQPTPTAASPRWTLWVLCGAAVALLLYALQHLPAQLELRLTENHPFLVVGWLGLECCFTVVANWIRQRRRVRLDRSAWILLALGLLGIGSFVAAIRASHFPGFFATDLTATRLTRLDGGVIADNLFAWFSREGVSARFLASVLPLLLLAGAAVRVVRGNRDGAARGQLVFTVGVAAALLAIAGTVLRAWSFFDVALLAVVVSATSTPARQGAQPARWPWFAGLLTLFPGIILLIPGGGRVGAIEISPREARNLIGRDLAQWIALKQPRAVVLAPPQLTGALIHHGGLRGLLTLDSDNREGFAGAARIAAAHTMEEAGYLLRQRGITHVVLPSWDAFLSQPGFLGPQDDPSAFIHQLSVWNLPPWLRPLPYFLPPVSGLEDTQLALFEVVPPQEAGTSLANLTEYFLETGRLTEAAGLAPLLRRYVTDVDALVAQYNLALALHDAPGAAAAFRSIVAAVAGDPAQEALTPDRRAALAVALARGGDEASARALAQRCAAEFSAPDVQTLTTRTLLRFLALLRAFGTPLEDPAARDLAIKLLPPGSRHF